MLRIWYNSDERPEGYDFSFSNKQLFRRERNPLWLQDDFTRRVVNTIDNADIETGFLLKSRVFKVGFTMEELCNGTRELLLMYYNKNPKKLFYGSNLGDNCAPFLVEIAEKKDINVLFDNYMELPCGEVDMVSMNTGKHTLGDPWALIDAYDEYYANAMISWKEKYELRA